MTSNTNETTPETKESPLIQKYRVMVVEKTSAPEGLDGSNWYRYVIGEGRSQIESKRTGSLKDVTEHAESVAEQINSRSGKRGSVYVTSKRK